MTQRNENGDPRVIAAIKHAVQLDSKGEIESAVQHLLALTGEFPSAASLHGYSALFLARAGRLDEAINHGRQAIQLSPTSERASLALFSSLVTAGQHMEALDEMKRFLALKPSEEYSKLIKDWDL